MTASGPYRLTRHPLYLGSTIIGIGFAVASANGWAAVVVVGLPGAHADVGDARARSAT